MNKNVLWLVCGQTCRDLQKKWFECVDLKTLRMHGELSSLLASMPVPDAYKKIQAYDQIRRRPGDIIGDYIVREQRAFREMTEALRRVRNSGVSRKLEHDVAVIKSPLEIHLSIRDGRRCGHFHRGNKNRPVRQSSGWKFGDTAFSKMHVSHEKRDRWSWLERETTRSTQRL